MKIILKLFATLSFCVISGAQAQSVPVALKSMFPQPNGKPRQTVSLRNLSVEQKEFLLKDTKNDAGGYLRVSVSREYIEQIVDVENANDMKVTRADNASSVLGMSFLGAKRESKFRVNYIFGGRTGAGAMITAWHYKEDGASFTVVDEFLNQSVAGMPATLSLATSSETRKCLWKLTASNDNMFYEVVIADTIINEDLPSMTVPQVLAAVSKLIAFTKSTG